MNLLKTVSVSIALALICSVAQGQNIEQSVFGSAYGVFVVVNNKAQLYEFDGESWVANSHYDFTLPSGYRSVYGYNDVLCVNVNNKVQLYKFNGSSWVVDAVFSEFALPDGYGSVFGSKRNTGAICVVVNNKVQLYGFGGTSVGWRTDSDADFSLTGGYQSVFGGSDGIGVSAGNKARFYEFKGGTWVADSRYDFTLPNGYGSVFGCKNDFNKWSEIFVVMNNNVHLYYFDDDNNSWVTNSDWDFVLPDK
jgi:hypothetical protein